ncbi:hypothetical protein SFB9_6044 [Klebsiella michiganensis]|nr:hypothetical protein SFB9_6044 [Klebsiella michiganensis]
MLKIVITDQASTPERIQLLLHIIQPTISGNDRINSVNQRSEGLPLCIDISGSAAHTTLERSHLRPGTGKRGLIPCILRCSLTNRISRLRCCGRHALFSLSLPPGGLRHFTLCP